MNIRLVMLFRDEVLVGTFMHDVSGAYGRVLELLKKDDDLRGAKAHYTTIVTHIDGEVVP